MNTPKPWDDSMKWLMRHSAQDLVTFLVPGALFRGDVDRELQAPSVAADVLHKILYQEKEGVLHVEFQLTYDKEMGERLWQYNALAHIHTKLPVHSTVIYLREAEKPWPESPHVIWYMDGRPTQRLDYDTIKLWEIPPETFEQEGLTGLLPLLPLAKGGKSVATVDRMADHLKKADKRELLALGYAIAWLAFGNEADTDWLKARFFEVHDILENTWIFQEIKKEGLQQGRQEGRQEGLQEGREEEKKRDIVQYIEIRFPSLLTLVKQKIEQAMPLSQLQVLLVNLYQASTLEDARSALQMEQAEGQ